MRRFFISVLMVVFTTLSASSVVGTVVKVEGVVKVKGENSIKSGNIKLGAEIKKGDLLTSFKSSNAVLKLVDGSMLVLGVNSAILFATDSSVEQKSGKIYYKITSRDAGNSIKVKTPFAIIGIKGTTFMVDATENASVVLKEGLIGVTSIKEEFELYRKGVQKQFDDFVNQKEADFKKFKDEQTKGVAEITKEFDLQAGNSISFSKNVVNEKAISKENDEELAYFEQIINSIKK
ncbi:FecR family protein [Sulfurimonas sp.]|uniref:FecR family protein n=1 Tax=Sulfurimonas sp. TaxID=2022749 RepID=UPI0025D201E0|nr:FecR family protein [Sulfurimonas sp.]MDD5157565.1 FecR family protein [Sulfurimonas sp.]